MIAKLMFHCRERKSRLCEISRWIFCQGLFLLLAGVAILFAEKSLAQQPDWSFQDHPHPLIDKYTKAELDYINKIRRNSKSGFYCANSAKAIYRIYNNRYPQYSKSTGGTALQFDAWKMHIIFDDRLPDYYHCFFLEPFEKFSDVMHRWSFSKKLLLCGNGDELVFAPDDQALKEIFYEAIEYAKTGRETAVEILISIAINYMVDLNPDLEYYIRKITVPDSDIGIEIRKTGHLETRINTERRKFLDKAVAARDYQAVFSTIQPCEPS